MRLLKISLFLAMGFVVGIYGMDDEWNLDTFEFSNSSAARTLAEQSSHLTNDADRKSSMNIEPEGRDDLDRTGLTTRTRPFVPRMSGVVAAIGQKPVASPKSNEISPKKHEGEDEQVLDKATVVCIAESLGERGFSTPLQELIITCITPYPYAFVSKEAIQSYTGGKLLPLSCGVIQCDSRNSGNIFDLRGREIVKLEHWCGKYVDVTSCQGKKSFIAHSSTSPNLLRKGHECSPNSICSLI